MLFRSVAVVNAAIAGEQADLTKASDVPYTLQLRYVIDDLKAFYTEAGAGGSMAPTSDELGEWFWRRSEGGRALLALRARLLEAPRDSLKTVGASFVVPRRWAERLGLA